MLQLIETICYEKGEFHRLALHEERLNRSRRHLFGLKDKLLILPFLQIPEDMHDQKVKCRLTYSDKIESIDYEIYTPKIIKNVKLVIDDAIDYSYKFKNRDSFNRLSLLRDGADEIFIIKNGFLTDASFANIILLKSNKWFTPASPLLFGTRLSEYLLNKIVTPLQISASEIFQFEQVRLINSMLSMDESLPISTKFIKK